MKRFWLLLIWAFLVPSAVPQSKREVVVAAAANFSEAFRALGIKFEAATGIHPVFSFGSTAQLATQVERGAPFDVFAGADTEHSRKLEREGMLEARTVFARGVLALWVPSGASAGLKDLGDARFRIIAMAKPELAPYGVAAVEALKRSGVWERVQPKVVYAENVSMAKQYGESGNADAVLTAYSVVARAGGRVLRIDPSLYGVMEHEVGIVAGAKHHEEGRVFEEYLARGPGQGVLQEFGYGVVRKR